MSPFAYAGGGLGGVVTAVTTGASVTIEEWNGTSATFTLTGTTYTEGTTTVTDTALVVGDRVRIQTAPGTMNATSVTIELAELFGTVKTVSGDTITITDWQGFTRTILVSATTTYNGTVSATVPSTIVTGTKIFAQGVVDSNGTTLDALSVNTGPTTNNYGFDRGTVTAWASPMLTVTSKGGTVTVFTVTSTTTYRDGKLVLSAADLAVGEHVGVWFNSSAATTALGVEIRLAQLTGTVTAISGDTITIADHQGFTRMILVSGTTTYNGVAATAIPTTLVVGVRIKAQGIIGTDGTTLDAINVDICGTPKPDPQPLGSFGHHHHGGGGFGGGWGGGGSGGGGYSPMARPSHDFGGGRGR